jgi:hypothetical protein
MEQTNTKRVGVQKQNKKNHLFFRSITQPKVGFELCFIFNQRNLWVSRKSRGKNQFFFFGVG